MNKFVFCTWLIYCILIVPGDMELKRDKSRPAEEQILTANPDIRTVCALTLYMNKLANHNDSHGLCLLLINKHLAPNTLIFYITADDCVPEHDNPAIIFTYFYIVVSPRTSFLETILAVILAALAFIT